MFCKEKTLVAAIAGVNLALVVFPWGRIFTVALTLSGVKSVAGVTVAIRDVIDAKEVLDDVAQVATDTYNEQERLFVDRGIKIDESIEAQKLYDACISDTEDKE